MLTVGWRLLDTADCVAPREQPSSPGGGTPMAGPPEGPPSSRLVRGPFFVDCILICWGLEFIGELLVVWRSCGSQRVRVRPELQAVTSAQLLAPHPLSWDFSLAGLAAGPGWRTAQSPRQEGPDRGSDTEEGSHPLLSIPGLPQPSRAVLHPVPCPRQPGNLSLFPSVQPQARAQPARAW